MSYDWYLFSPQMQPVHVAKLRTELETRGWRVAFLGEENLLPKDGALGEFCVVVGCDSTHTDVEVFAPMTDVQSVADWVAQSENAVICEVICVSPYRFSDDFDEEEIEDIRAESGDDYVQARLAAQSHYVLSSALDEASLDFGDSVARALAEIIGGLLEDPQEDVFEIIAPK